ncbi:hypothetical protein Poli38472_004639 [Pythium oligandrum]|uniref:Kinesin motor domain-containing protein n=1 Tax=Pythium oligandrum TaxID=41045 RepID=A0A8K1CB49_PYTOL|nr:hypothetical protein Poli38472_004639 [Pythium oligandrum]|eukprot:TMW59570.1 hypothetical protein Poli38472_004639 [Pythium oligandrum]
MSRVADAVTAPSVENDVAMAHAGAQVAPLPHHIKEFHVGALLSDPSDAVVAPRREEEERYIPVTLAKAHLARVVQDMHAMKENQTRQVNVIVEQYKKMEQESKTYYEEYITTLKKRARDKLTEAQDKYKALEDTLHEQTKRAEEERTDMVEKHAREEEAHEKAAKRMRQVLETSCVQYEEQMTWMQKQVALELRRVVGEREQEMHGVEVCARNQLLMNWEDVQAASMRQTDRLHRLQHDMETKEAAYRREIRRIQEQHTIDHEVYRCVSTVINRVVDMEHQLVKMKRTKELQTEIKKLQQEVKRTTQQHDGLMKRLHEAQARWERAERASVKQAMDSILRTIELQPKEPRYKPPVKATMQDNGFQTQTEEQKEVKAVRPSMSDVGIETNPPPARQDAETEPMSVVPELSLLSGEQLQYEADVERYKERNAALVRSKQELRVVKTQMQSCLEDKNAAKARIKQWLSDFQAKYGRDPTIEEKAQVKELYLAFKESEDKYNKTKEQVAVLKTAHHERVVEVEALSQWHALAASSSRRAKDSDEDNSAREQGSSDQGPRPVSREVLPTDSSAKVLQLEDEVKSLRQALETTRLEQDKPVSPQNQESSSHALDTVPLIAEEKATAMTPRDEVSADEKQQLKMVREELTKYTKESKALNVQREELRTTIAALTSEIADRREEKTRLETQIEQLRLHAELMESDDSALLATSEEKHGAERQEEEEGDEEDQEEANTAVEEDQDMAADAKTTPQAPALTDNERADGAKEAQLLTLLREAIDTGKMQWNRGDKAKCHQIYVRACEKSIELLREMRTPRRVEVGILRSALQEASKLPPARSSTILRKQLDMLVAMCENHAKDREAKVAAAARAASITPVTSPVSRASPQRKAFKKGTAGEETTETPNTSSGPVNKALEGELKQKLKALEAKQKADKVRITQLEAALSKTEMQLSAASTGGGNAGGANSVLLERKLADAEKKHTKAMEDAEKSAKKEVTALTQQLQTVQAKSQGLQEQIDKLTKELATVGGKASQLSKIEEEVVTLRTKAAQVESLTVELAASRSEYGKLETSYKEEQSLRKKYYNMIEDMKGKIRVYARCRPMSSSENERGCQTCVRFVDEFSMELKTSHGPKTFAYDHVFPPASTQDEVFEDTKNLLQSAIDGYNVCIFAYGQTGSGKTFTMTGSESLPGLTPRAIHHLFRLAEETRSNNTITFQAFMLELYNDNLIDLLHLVDGGSSDKDAPKLDIKKNDKGMVFVQNITTKGCTNAQQTLKLFDAANKKRQVGATKMNAESSRSHSVFSILIENYNKTTKATSIGKLSLVDLAGSERAGKTGATADRLKEAQAINKSLSALGDVIAALSSNEKFIPYRNNKLTQLMQDSLGGNAKTLMFVNISPADYNQEETQTSLQYASRVKLITNNANKTSESEQVNRLKAIIRQLRSGKTDVDLEGVLD